LNSKNKIHVLFIITGLNPGGAEKVVFDLSRKIAKDLFNVFVVSLSNKVALFDLFQRHGIATYSMNMKKTPKDLIKTILYLSKFIKKNRIRIIHCHMTHAMILSTILKMINWNVKVVFTSHNVKFGSFLRELIIFILKPFRDVDIIFSKDVLRYYFKKNKKIIPNGIDISTYKTKAIKYDKFTIIAVGRLEKVKNHLALIGIADFLRNKLDFKLIIAGDGELKERLHQKIKEKNLENYITLLGFNDNITELLTKSHLFVMPSKWEGMPISILEAAVVGLPILSTPVGSIPSLINEQTGFLSNIDSFTEQIYFIYQNYNEALKRASVLQKLVYDNYSIDTVVKEHEQLYLSLAQ